MNKRVMFSSITCEWQTPQSLFDQLNMEFKFEIDVCATRENAMCSRFYTLEDNGLSKQWSGSCWMNPPYGRTIARWLEKAYLSSCHLGTTVVALIPARTDTDWWHRFVMRAEEIRFVKGRLNFSGHNENAPFPSAVAIFGRIIPAS